jgi:hypothetical protein
MSLRIGRSPKAWGMIFVRQPLLEESRSSDGGCIGSIERCDDAESSDHGL